MKTNYWGPDLGDLITGYRYAGMQWKNNVMGWINLMWLRRRYQGVSEPILLAEEAVSEEGSSKALEMEFIVFSVFIITIMKNFFCKLL